MKSIKTSLFAGFCAVLVLAVALLSGCENVGGRQNNLFSIDEKSEQKAITTSSVSELPAEGSEENGSKSSDVSATAAESVATFDAYKLADDFEWSLEDGMLTISGHGKMPDYDSHHEQPWYRNESDITDVIINDGITSIGKNAFAYCTHLANVTVPSSVITIEERAFDRCMYGLKSLTLPEGVVMIADWAFCNCDALGKVMIPKSVQSIGKDAFSYDSLHMVNGHRYYFCPKLVICAASGSYAKQYAEYIGIPFTATVSVPTFENLSWSLEDGVLTISGSGDMVKADGENLQWDEKWPWTDEMPNVRKIVVESGITSIGDNAFDNGDYTNEILEEVSLPEGITQIGGGAFAYTTIKSITLPESVKIISDNAFTFSAIRTINLPDSLEYIGDFAFRCSYITSVIIPDGVKYIGTYCFQGCGDLTDVEFKGTVDDIGDYAFQETSFVDITLPSEFEPTSNLFVWSNIESVVIPDGVTTIPNDFIVDCENFKSITIPVSVTSIGKSAFGTSEYNGEDFVTIPINTFTIHAPAGSYAEKYAKENNIPFEAE